MSALERQAHWQNVYQTKGERDVSWFQESPAISLDLIRATGVGADASIIDIGGGTSRLVDVLVAEGFRSVTVLDLSEKALATSRKGLASALSASTGLSQMSQSGNPRKPMMCGTIVPHFIF